MSRRNVKREVNSRVEFSVAQSDPMQNSATTLLANIGFSGIDDDVKSVVITSSVPNEGKTTVAMALAVAMARTGEHCLLLECDMRCSSLRTALGVHCRHGLYDVLTNKCKITDAIVRTGEKNLYFMDAESGIPSPDALLSSKRFKQMLEFLEDKFAFIVLDTPPVTAFPDAAIAGRAADATLLVMRDRYTEMREAELAVEQLQSANVNLIGAVYNGLKMAGGKYAYSYSYYYNNDESDSSTVIAGSKNDSLDLEDF